MTTAADRDLATRLENDGGHPDLAHPLCIEAAAEIRSLMRSVADLRHERDTWQSLAADANRAALHHSQRHLEERQHADELAEVLRITVRDWCPSTVRVPILDHHQARREQ